MRATSSATSSRGRLDRVEVGPAGLLRVPFGLPGERLPQQLPTLVEVPARDDIRDQQDRPAEALNEVYARLGNGQRLLLEYTFSEPAIHHTDVADWVTVYTKCLKLGRKAQVVVGTGHHTPGAGIEFVVASLPGENKLGAFDFSSASTPTTT